MQPSRIQINNRIGRNAYGVYSQILAAPRHNILLCYVYCVVCDNMHFSSRSSKLGEIRPSLNTKVLRYHSFSYTLILIQGKVD